MVRALYCNTLLSIRYHLAPLPFGNRPGKLNSERKPSSQLEKVYRGPKNITTATRIHSSSNGPVVKIYRAAPTWQLEQSKVTNAPHTPRRNIPLSHPWLYLCALVSPQANARYLIFQPIHIRTPLALTSPFSPMLSKTRHSRQYHFVVRAGTSARPTHSRWNHSCLQFWIMLAYLRLD